MLLKKFLLMRSSITTLHDGPVMLRCSSLTLVKARSGRRSCSPIVGSRSSLSFSCNGDETSHFEPRFSGGGEGGGNLRRITGKDTMTSSNDSFVRFGHPRLKFRSPVSGSRKLICFGLPVECFNSFREKPNRKRHADRFNSCSW